MWKLTIEDDEGKQTSLPLAHEEYGVGRAEENAIRLTDRNVSRKHATLKKNGHGWFIKDLASYNGTYVNGVRVAGEQTIGNGDVVQLGDYRLELIDEAVATAGAVGAADAPVHGPPALSHQRPDRLVVVVGPTPGAEYPLDREHFSIGRAEDATISINHTSVSRLHAELIAIGNGRYEIVDKGSANGIRINGVELKRGILEAGDALELGDVRMRFVGAGKIFRAGADQSQQLSAVSAFESVAPSVRAPPGAAPAPGRRGGGQLVGIGVAVGLLLLVVILLAVKPGSSAQTVPIATMGVESVDIGKQLLEDAKALLKGGDVEGAHKKALQVPENSAARDDAAFKEIEAKWADSIFEKVNQTSDAAEQKKLLALITSTQSVDPERRKKAVEMLTAIQASAPEPTTPTPPPNPGIAIAPPPAGYPPGPGPGPGTTYTPPPPKTAEPTPVPTVPPSGVMDDETTRRALGPKAWAGKASESELRMLKAACRNLGDTACRDRAAALLKKKQEEKGQ